MFLFVCVFLITDELNELIKCMVCGDTSTGFHYGIHSCEGCKVSTALINVRKNFSSSFFPPFLKGLGHKHNVHRFTLKSQFVEDIVCRNFP